MTYKIAEAVISPYYVNDIDPELYQLGIEYHETPEECIKNLVPLLNLLAEDLRNNPSGSTIDQVAKHLRLMADSAKHSIKQEH